MSDLATLGFKVDTSGLARGERGLDSFSRKGRQTEGAIDRSSKGIVRSFRSIEISIGTLAKAFVFLQGLSIGRDVLQQADAWTGLTSQIRQVTDSTEELITRRQELIALSKETRSGLVETTKLYAELYRSTSNLGISENRLLGVTRTLNNLFVSGGRPISEVNGAIRQLSQGFAAGTLRGDEFNSVAENAPRVLDALTQHLNMTRGELREFAATGGITAEIMVAALEKYASQAQELADRTEMTFGQAMEVANTNILTFLGNLDSLNGAIGWLGETIIDVTDTMAVFAASGQLEASLDLLSSKFSGITKDVKALRDLLGEEPNFISAFIDEALDVTSEAFINFPENIRALVKIITVELASIIDIGSEYFMLMVNAIGLQLSHLPTVAQAHIMAFGQVVGVELAKYVDIFAAYGQKIVEVLNPFDESTFDLDAAIARAEAVASGMTDAILGEADAVIAESQSTTDTLLQQYQDQADGRIQASKDARMSVIDDVLAEREAAIASSDAQIEAIGKMGEAYRKLEEDRLAAVGEGAGTGLNTSPTAAQLKELDQLIKKVDKFGGAWKRTGSVIVDAFGSLAAQLNDYNKRIKEIGLNEQTLAEQRLIHGAENEDIIRLETELQNQRAEAEIANMRNIAGATASMFDEKTAAHKAFAALNQALAVAEIALAWQKITASNTETATHVANETTKQGANALTAITSAFAAPFPVNFAAGAAMIGIMAALLGTTFSGGGSSYDPTEDRQANQGTGTLLGSDEKSNSIVESSERLEDIQIDQLAELRGIRDSMRSLSSGISQLAKSVVAGMRFDGGFSGNFGEVNTGFTASLGESLSSIPVVGGLLGGIIGGFSSTKKKLLDSGIEFFSQTLGEILESGDVEAAVFAEIETTKSSWWGLSKDKSTSIEYQDIDTAITGQMADIFGFIGDSVIGAATSLGFETANITRVLVDEVWEDVAQQVRGGSRGQWITTGVISTLISEAITENVDVALVDAIKEFEIDLPKISLEGLSGEEIQAELEAVFSQQADLITEFLVPSMKEFQEIGEGLFETLIRVSQEQAVFNDTIARLGMSLADLPLDEQIRIGQDLIGLFGGLDEFRAATNSFFEEFFSEEEQLAMLEQSLSDVFSSLNMSLVTTKEEFRALVEGADLTTEEGRNLYATLLEISPAMADYIEALQDSEEAIVDNTRALEDSARSAFSMVQDAINLQKQAAQASFDAATDQYLAEQERLDGLRQSLEQEKVLRDQNLAVAEEALKKSFSSEMELIKDNAAAQKDAIKNSAKTEIDLIQASSKARIDGLNAEKKALNATASALRSLVSSATNALGTSTSAQLKAAFDAARRGDFSQAQGLDFGALAALEEGQFGSEEEFRRQQARNRFRIGTIGTLAEAELTDTERTLSRIDAQIAATNSSRDAMVDSINAARDAQIAEIEDQAAAQIAELQAQLDALLSVDNTVLSLEEAIAQYQAAQQALDELAYEDQVSRLDMLVQSNEEVYELARQAYEDEIERLDDLLTSQEMLLDAALGIDNSVLSVEEAINQLAMAIGELSDAQEDTMQVAVEAAKASTKEAPLQTTAAQAVSSDVKETMVEIKDQNQRSQEMMMAVVKSSRQTADILQRFEYDGIDTRQIQ